MLAYLMGQEAEWNEEVEAVRFQNDMFLHAIANQNPALYRELYEEPDVPEEWEVPQSPADLSAMMAELAELGVSLHAPGDEHSWSG